MPALSNPVQNQQRANPRVHEEKTPHLQVPGQTHLVLKSSAASLALSMCTIILAFSALVHRTCQPKHTEQFSAGCKEGKERSEGVLISFLLL